MASHQVDTSEARAGRGFLWLTAAKFYFMLAGWAIYFILPRLMSEVDWGRFLSVLFLVSILNNVMVTSAVQGVSRFTAAEPHRAWPALRGGLGLFLLLGGLCTLALLLGAPLLAWLHADPSLTPLYRAAAFIAFGYALYAACIGSLNGQQRFGAQAGFDVSYATLRLGLMVAGALLAGRAAAARGAHFGYSTGALVICAVALWWVALPQRRRHEGEPRVAWGPLVVFVLPVAMHQLSINLLMRTDALAIKALTGHLAAGDHAAELASVLAARYGTAMVFALVPYQALIALSMVVFPLVADAAAAERRDALQRTARGALRFALILGAGLAALLASQSANVIDLVYPEAYRAGGVALRWQAWGVIGLSLTTLSCTMLNAAGYVFRVLLLTVVTWAVQLVTVVLVLRGVSTPEDALRFTAMGNAAVLLTGALAAALVLRSTFAVRLPVATALRVGLAAAVATALGHALAGRSLVAVLGVGLGVAAVYLAILVITRELGAADARAVLRVVRPKR